MTTSLVCGFGFLNVVNAPTSISAGSGASPTLPIINLQSDYGASSMGYQSAGTTMDINITFPAQMIRVVSVHRTNMTAAATCWVSLTLAGATVYSYGATGNNQPVSMQNNQFVLVLPNDVTADSIQIEFYDPANPQGFINVPLCYVGPLWQPTRNMSFDSTETVATGTDVATSRTGVEFVTARWVQRGYKVDHQSLDQTDMPTVRQVRAWGNQGRNVLFVPNPAKALADVNGQAIYGRLVTGDITNPFGASLRQQTTFTLTERL